MPKRISSLAAAFLLILGLWPGEAQAYLDPGTGSFVLQAAAVALMAAAGAWQALKARIKGLFRKKPKPGETGGGGA